MKYVTVTLKNERMSFPELQAYAERVKRDAKLRDLVVSVWVSGDVVKVRATDETLKALFNTVPG